MDATSYPDDICASSFLITGPSTAHGFLTYLLIYLVPEASEMDYEEMPSYSGMQLFSDIGGAACLGMGVSMASIVGIFEYIIYKYGTIT